MKLPFSKLFLPCEDWATTWRCRLLRYHDYKFELKRGYGGKIRPSYEIEYSSHLACGSEFIIFYHFCENIYSLIAASHQALLYFIHNNESGKEHIIRTSFPTFMWNISCTMISPKRDVHVWCIHGNTSVMLNKYLVQCKFWIFMIIQRSILETVCKSSLCWMTVPLQSVTNILKILQFYIKSKQNGNKILTLG